MRQIWCTLVQPAEFGVQESLNDTKVIKFYLSRVIFFSYRLQSSNNSELEIVWQHKQLTNEANKLLSIKSKLFKAVGVPTNFKWNKVDGLLSSWTCILSKSKVENLFDFIIFIMFFSPLHAHSAPRGKKIKKSILRSYCQKML